MRKALIPNVGEADLKLLRVFKSVSEAGGLAAAEAQLNIGRSTISKHIADLELRLGLQLCHRGPSGFALTEDGSKVLESADRLIAAASNFRREVHEIKEQLAGSLRVAVFDQSASNPDARLPDAIYRFGEIAPNVELHLSVEAPTTIEQKLLSGDLDVGILARHRPSDSLSYKRLYGENMFLYCGDRHDLFGLPDEELSDATIFSTKYAGIGVNSPNFEIGRQLKMKLSATVQNEHALKILILSGQYIGFLPMHLAQPHINEGKMREILPDRFYYSVQFEAVVRRNPKPSRVTELFLNALLGSHDSQVR